MEKLRCGLRRFQQWAGQVKKENIDGYLASPQFILQVMLITALAHTLALELLAYAFFVGVAVYVCRRGEDLLPLMPLVVASYILPSSGNNPGKWEASVFAPGHGGVCIALLAAALLWFLGQRVYRDRKIYFSKERKLLPGLLILAAAYLLGGLGRKGYFDSALQHLLFAFVQGASLVVPYFLFTAGVNWKKVRKDYFAWLGIGVACVLLWEIFWVYCTREVILNGYISRNRLYTGWGIYNNIGCLLMLMIPFAFQLAWRYDRDWVGGLGGAVLLVGVLMTASRNASLVGAGVYGVCMLWMLRRSSDRERKQRLVLGLTGMVVLIGVLFSEQLLYLFRYIIMQGLSFHVRDTIYEEGLRIFTQSPVFGASFFSPGYEPWEWSENESFARFFPPRWHNTPVQLLACCGLVGLGAYVLHRVQTARLFLQKTSPEKWYIGISLAGLLLSSWFDCHFFNIGPGLWYSMALAFAEGIALSQIPRNCRPNAPWYALYTDGLRALRQRILTLAKKCVEKLRSALWKVLKK